MIKGIMGILFILFIVFAVGYAIYYSPTGLGSRSAYSTQLSTDKPNKIKDTISSAMSDLEKRDFVPVYLEVKWHPASKTYVIYAMGIDRTKLDKYEP